MIELAAFLILVGLCLLAFKLFALVFKAGVFVLTIPFQILGALFVAFLILLLFPFALVTGILAAVFAPLLILGPFLPLLLVALGIYLIVKH
jgi:hypothetical protein